jgi:hypothetical protein
MAKKTVILKENELIDLIEKLVVETKAKQKQIQESRKTRQLKESLEERLLRQLRGE